MNKYNNLYIQNFDEIISSKDPIVSEDIIRSLSKFGNRTIIPNAYPRFINNVHYINNNVNSYPSRGYSNPTSGRRYYNINKQNYIIDSSFNINVKYNKNKNGFRFYSNINKLNNH